MTHDYWPLTITKLQMLGYLPAMPNHITFATHYRKEIRSIGILSRASNGNYRFTQCKITHNNDFGFWTVHPKLWTVCVADGCNSHLKRISDAHITTIIQSKNFPLCHTVNPADLESGARDRWRACDELDSGHFRIAHSIDEETVKRMERLDAYKSHNPPSHI